MKAYKNYPNLFAIIVLMLGTVCVHAQSGTDPNQSGASTGPTYQITPDTRSTPPPDSASTQDAANVGPVRLARFSYVDGDVTWRPSSTDDWSSAGVNIPLREGAEVWVTNGGRAEVQFDDGSYLRLGDGAIVTLQTLSSDATSEFTELQLNQGLVTLKLKNPASDFQVDTPLATIKVDGGDDVRVGVGDGVEIAVHGGTASLSNANSSTDLNAGNYVYLADASSPFDIGPIPHEDSWDQWNDSRNALIEDAQTDDHCPSDVATCAGNLDTYGVWREDPQYGWVWCPDEPVVWRPYEYGTWVDCEPFGWTWCSTEPWGWAPYHYGTWFHAGYGWAWCPGPARQYWSPAVVCFSYYDGYVGWCPLAPGEIDYTSLSFAFERRGFAFGFSIAEAGCYYPGPNGFCLGIAFSTYNANNFGRPGFHENGHFGDHNPYASSGRFVPRNAHYGGVLTASTSSFGDSQKYRTATGNGADFFSHGQVVTAPKGNARPFSGPVAAKSTSTSLSASRQFQPAEHPVAQIARPTQAIGTTTKPAQNTLTERAQPSRPDVSWNPISGAGLPARNTGSTSSSDRSTNSQAAPVFRGATEYHTGSNTSNYSNRGWTSGGGSHSTGSQSNSGGSRGSWSRSTQGSQSVGGGGGNHNSGGNQGGGSPSNGGPGNGWHGGH